MWSEWSVKQFLEAHVILSQSEMTILTIDEFYCKNAVKFKKHAANKSDQWPFQVIFFEVSHFTSYIYIYINFILSTMAVTRGICLSLSLLLWIATWGFVCVSLFLHVSVPGHVWDRGNVFLFLIAVCCGEGSWGNCVCRCIFVHKHIQLVSALIEKEASILHICCLKQTHTQQKLEFQNFKGVYWSSVRT